MTNAPLSDAEISALELGDVDLLRIEWTGNESPNLRLILARPNGKPPLYASLLFTWVDKLRVDLDLARSFRAMTWDVVFHRESDRWQVLFDFASAGKIEFEFMEIFNEPVEGRKISI